MLRDPLLTCSPGEVLWGALFVYGLATVAPALLVARALIVARRSTTDRGLVSLLAAAARGERDAVSVRRQLLLAFALGGCFWLLTSIGLYLLPRWGPILCG